MQRIGGIELNNVAGLNRLGNKDALGQVSTAREEGTLGKDVTRGAFPLRGVGGRVAEMVGRRLHELGTSRQILCVTHLPQVASLADQHFRISKVSDGKATRTGVADLGKEERIEELARMLGGVEITQKTIDHAAEMLAVAARKRA